MRPLAALAITLALACGGSPPPAGEGGAGSGPLPRCTLSLRALGPDGAFTDMVPDAPVGLIAGFQGFVYLLVRVRADGPDFDLAHVRIFTRVEGGSPAAGHEGDDGFALGESDDLMVFFNGTPYGELLGKTVRLEVSLRSRACEGDAELTARLEPGVEPT